MVEDDRVWLEEDGDVAGNDEGGVGRKCSFLEEELLLYRA